mgnify:CR=1 FL=1
MGKVVLKVDKVKLDCGEDLCSKANYRTIQGNRSKAYRKIINKIAKGEKKAHNKNAQGWVKGESSDGVAIKSRS